MSAPTIHPRFKLGLNPHGLPDAKLLAVQWKAGKIPDYPPAVDNMAKVTPGLDGNDQFGDCGPTSVDNHNRVTTLAEAGAQVDATLDQVFDLYRRSGNPNFDPTTDADDNGVDMATMMQAVRSGGLAGKKIVAFGRLSDTSDASVMAAISLFGAVLFAVDLQIAQQNQSDETNPVWDYKKSGEWGGHAIVAAAYDSGLGMIDVFSWAMRVSTTAAFRSHQLQEVWVPIWPELLISDKFAQNVDVAALAADFNALTGSTLPVPTPPAPPAPPTPPAPSGGGASFQVSAEVAARVDHAATRAKLSGDAWLEHRLRSYFEMPAQ